MKAKPVIPRVLARRDVDEAFACYLHEEAGQAALGFIDALAHAYTQIGRHPTIGSPRYASELNLPGLRCWRLAYYPYLAFYIERIDHIDVQRVLHAQRDIAEWMQGFDVP